MIELDYSPLEKLKVSKPVIRINYIKSACENKGVLDLGCYDETALIKSETGYYLFDEISSVCTVHIGVDNSSKLPEEGIIFSEKVRILKGDIYNLNELQFDKSAIAIIVAGELIEHLPNTLQFLRNIKTSFNGKRLICTTPNTTSAFNMVLSTFKRESAHKDHLQVYSYKTLNTICTLAGFKEWKLIPYHVRFTEMILSSKGLKRSFSRFSEKMVNAIEYCFPMSAGGYIIDITI